MRQQKHAFYAVADFPHFRLNQGLDNLFKNIYVIDIYHYHREIQLVNMNCKIKTIKMIAKKDCDSVGFKKR